MTDSKTDKNGNTDQTKSSGKFDLGSFFKGLFQKKPKPDKAPTTPTDDKSEEAPAEKQAEEQDTAIRPKKPRTKATIQVAPERRVFQHVAIVGKPSGTLQNMETILLRRGYDVVHIPLTSSKRGAFARLEFGRPIPEETECAIICEPETLDEARFAIEELRDKKGFRIAIVCRKLSIPQWVKEILQPFQLQNKFLVRFSYAGLLKIFQLLAAEPAPTILKQTTAKTDALKPKPTSDSPSSPAPVKASGETESPELVETPQLEEVPTAEPHVKFTESLTSEMQEIEPLREVLSSSTNRPMAVLAKVLAEPMVHFQIKGKEDQGIAPERILTRKEFEALFHASFQEQWKITRIQDPKAMPPLIIRLDKLSDSSESPESEDSPLSQEQQQVVETIAESVSFSPDQEDSVPSKDTFKPVLKKPVNLDEKIREVRKWWQQGRTAKIYNELESLRCSGTRIADIDGQEVVERLTPLIEGAILFAKGRLDRSIDGTLNELFTEDLAKNGLESSLRLAALTDREDLPQEYRETMEKAKQGIHKTLNSLCPNEQNQEAFLQASEDVRELLIQLDELVDGTLSLDRITPPMIYDYFDKLHKITMALHNQFHIIDPGLLIFGRLDRVIVRSQTRSDWAFDHTEDDAQWNDRVQKFLHFLAEIRIEIFRVRDEINLLEMILHQNPDAAIAEAASRIRHIITPGTVLERLDTEHLRLSEDNSRWHIVRHRGNYLIDLKNEEDEAIRAFAAFDEEAIEYGWIGIYRHPRLQYESGNDTG